jgi:Zn-dependent protease
MRDPLTWSLPLGRLFGITIRVHVLFIAVALGQILYATRDKAMPGEWKAAAAVMAVMFVSVLLHEFGHCFGARIMDGDAQEILMWPLGGLAFVEVPHTAWANFVTIAAGPLVNLVLSIASGIVLSYHHLEIPWKLWIGYPYDPALGVGAWQVWVQWVFWVNLLQFTFNVFIPAYPMDGGRLVQCALWPRYGYRQATSIVVVLGFVSALIMGIVGAVMEDKQPGYFMLALAIFIYVTCRQQFILLEQGGEDSVFGYDFSAGYTSLERDQPAPRRRRRPNFIRRWLDRRAAKKMHEEMEQREAEERRMDELLDKVNREGLQALTDEERRFLTRVSAKYRNRQ